MKTSTHLSISQSRIHTVSWILNLFLAIWRMRWGWLGGWRDGYEHLLLLQKSRVQLPSPIADGSQAPVTPVPEDPHPLLFSTGTAHTCPYPPMNTHIT